MVRLSKPVAGYPSQKAAILAFHARGIPEPQIAAELALPINTVRARILEAGRFPNLPRDGRTRPAADEASPPSGADDMPKQIMVTLHDAVFKGVAGLADKAKMLPSAYAAHLLTAAYSARVKPPTGDRDLDKAVARVAILHAEDRNTADIADAVGLTEATVCRVLDAWRDEMGRAA